MEEQPYDCRGPNIAQLNRKTYLFSNVSFRILFLARVTWGLNLKENTCKTPTAQKVKEVFSGLGSS